jgi:transcriptional regulator with XRE-family HTH domain
MGVERRWTVKLSKVISRRLKALREAAGLSQQEVAMRADLSLSLVAKMEQGKKADPRASTLLALAQALGVRPGEILDDLFAPPIPAPVPALAGVSAVSAEAPPVGGNGETAGPAETEAPNPPKRKGKGKGKGKGKAKHKKV